MKTSYATVISRAIDESGWSLAQIRNTMKKRHGVDITKSMLSKMQTGVKVASEEVNRALVDVLEPVTSITFEELRVSLYRDQLETIPVDVLQVLVTEKFMQFAEGGDPCVSSQEEHAVHRTC